MAEAAGASPRCPGDIRQYYRMAVLLFPGWEGVGMGAENLDAGRSAGQVCMCVVEAASSLT